MEVGAEFWSKLSLVEFVSLNEKIGVAHVAFLKAGPNSNLYRIYVQKDKVKEMIQKFTVEQAHEQR